MQDTVATRGIGPRHIFAIALIVFWGLCLLTGYARPEWGQAMFFSQVLALSLFALVHGSERYGLPRMLVFLVVMQLSVHGFENLSIITGVPFGFFEHTASMGPKLFHVPLIVGFAYFSAGYLGWVLASLLLGEADRERGVLALISVPLVAMFITTAWDACIDPLGGTVARNWIWPEGGGYYGVPLSNYIGWLVTSYVAFQIFALLLARSGAPVTGGQSRLWWALPAIQFGVMSLQYPLNLVFFPDVVVTDPGGGEWRTGDIYEGTTVVSIFTMMFIAVTCLLIALRRPTAADAAIS